MSQIVLNDPAPRAQRLELALGAGLTLPEGPISVLRPRAGEDFSSLGADRLTLVTGFRPDHDALTQTGYRVAVQAADAPVALVCLPRARAEGLALIAQAVAQGARLVLVDGQKTDGIEAVMKAVRARVDLGGSLSKAHGKLFWFAPDGADFNDWMARPGKVSDPLLGQFETVPGVFSADGVDEGSALLAQHLPDTLPARMADLGAGWGYLSAACLARSGVTAMHLIEAEAAALALSRRNIPDPRAQFHWLDACADGLGAEIGPIDAVVMNPPFHTGRKAQPALGQAFIAVAARLLGQRGRLWMVANRHLPYADALAQHFSAHDIIAETPGFRVWQAAGPRRKPATVTRNRRQG